jgi:hypothetical protein
LYGNKKLKNMKAGKFYAILLFLLCSGNLMAQDSITIYLNPYSGDDANTGSKDKPLKTLVAASRMVNDNTSNEAITIILAGGIYTINETSTFKPTKRTFTKTARLTIRAEILPDDENWNTGSMPTFIHTMQLSDWWQGQKDPFGGTAYGIMIEMSHVTIQGLKILGMPVVEHPKEGYIQRVYPIARLNPEFDDLEIIQCFFAGDEVTNPNHLPIIANGTGIVLDHCLFYHVKQGIVYWSRNSTGHAMRNCLIIGNYGCGIWTSAIANDFDFRNNVIANGNYIWISQLTRDRGQQEVGTVKSEPIHYKVYNSLFAGNLKYVGTGGGPALNFKDVEPTMLELINTKLSDKPIAIEMDQSKKNYLHPIAGSEAEKIGAGLFKK